jgi:hypothetical protein
LILLLSIRFYFGELDSMQCLYDQISDPAPQCLIEQQTNDNEGFSLVELLMVVGVIALILWVLIPIGLRTRIDAKYGVIRQNCSELASYTSQWAHQAIMAQDQQESFATLADYYGSLAGLYHAPTSGPAPGEWIANNIGPSNWRQNRDDKNSIRMKIISGRFMNGKNPTAPENTVENIIPRHSPILNPFTNVDVFAPDNFPFPKFDDELGTVPGAIAFGGFREKKGGWVNYAFVFQGTNNTGTQLDGPDTFFSGMNVHTIEGLQKGIFAARIR